MSGGDLRCDVCRKDAPGAMPAPELRLTLCMWCDADLVAWLTTGGDPQEWPALEQSRRAAVARAALVLGRPPLPVQGRREVHDWRGPIDQATRERAARGIAAIKAQGGWTT